MEIRKKKTPSSFLLHVPKVYSLVTHEFLSQSSNTARLPVQRTAEQETGRNMEGGGERVEGVCVCQEKWCLVVGLKDSQTHRHPYMQRWCNLICLVTFIVVFVIELLQKSTCEWITLMTDLSIEKIILLLKLNKSVDSQKSQSQSWKWGCVWTHDNSWWQLTLVLQDSNKCEMYLTFFFYKLCKNIKI